MLNTVVLGYKMVRETGNCEEEKKEEEQEQE